jgi:site-specific DNA recombinase
MRAVSYLRVSSKEQEKEGFSIAAQQALVAGYAANLGMVAAHEFVDVETAKEAGRSQFGAMVALVKAQPDIRKIFVEKTDRLYRNLRDSLALSDLDVEIHFIKENVVLRNDSRSSDKFMHGLKVLLAKQYVDNLSEETKKGLTQKAKEGFWPGQAPLGYRNVMGASGKRIIEPDPVMGPIFRRVAHWFAEGVHPLRDAVAKAREEGLRTKKGAVLPKSTIHQMLRNPIYAGSFYWKEELHEGKHTPLISQEMYERIIGILDGRFAKRHRKVSHNFAYAKLIECGHCGCSIVGELKKQKYVYYRCTHAKQKCPDKHVREEVLDAQFTAAVNALSFDQTISDWVATALRESHGDEKRYREQAMARLQGEYTRLQSRIDAMYVDKLDGKITAASFVEKAALWRGEQTGILGRMSQHQGANQSYIEDGVRLLELAKRAGKLFEKQVPSEKRKMLKLLLSNSRFQDGTLSVTYRQPFDMLVKTIAADKAAPRTGTDDLPHSEIWLRLQDSNLMQSTPNATLLQKVHHASLQTDSSKR